MAVIGVVSGTTVAWLMGALTWGVDFSPSFSLNHLERVRRAFCVRNSLAEPYLSG
jgi:hypothetical protein